MIISHRVWFYGEPVAATMFSTTMYDIMENGVFPWVTPDTTNDRETTTTYYSTATWDGVVREKC